MAMHSTADLLRDLGDLILGYRFHFRDEAELQSVVASLLERTFTRYEPEQPLRPFGRIDFYLPGERVGIEIKVKGSPSAVISQVHRYCRHPAIDGLLLLSTKSSLRHLPERMQDKPVRAVTLWANGL